MFDVSCTSCGFSCVVTNESHGSIFPRCSPGCKVPKCKSISGKLGQSDGTMWVLLYYSYVKISDVESALSWHKKLCEHLDIKGRVRIASEGLNIILDGRQCALQCYCDAVQAAGVYGQEIDFKLSPGQSNQRFPKLSCKAASHVVEMGIDDAIARPDTGARHVDPDEWHALLSEISNAEGPMGDTIIWDTRNIYESRIGRFECNGAKTLAPDFRHFAQLPNFVDESLEQFQGKRVLMYCTGGVRCERASSYLLSKDIAKEVVQLKGGICRYLERFEGQPGFFRGKNFVFDYRRYEPRHDQTVLGRCDGCAQPWDDYDNGPEAHCSTCRTLLLLCDQCRSSPKFKQLDTLLCGGDSCAGEQIRCGCGCGPSCTAGPICKRTGYLTRQPANERHGNTARLDQKLDKSAHEATSARSRCNLSCDPKTLQLWHGCLPFGQCFLDVLRGASHLFMQQDVPLSLDTHVREATEADAEACFTIVNQAWTVAYGSLRYRNLSALLEAIRLHCVLVACDGHGNLLGCAEHKVLQQDDVLDYGPVAVSPHIQGHGLGTALIDEIERRAQRCGCRCVRVELRRQFRERLEGFYERRGYQHCGPRKRNYITMSKPMS